MALGVLAVFLAAGAFAAVRSSRGGQVWRVSEADARSALDEAVRYALLHDAEGLCSVGAELTCERSLSRLEAAGVPWPDAAPVVVFSHRFEGERLASGLRTGSGHVLTVCARPDGVATDFVVYDGVGAPQVRDPVFWSAVAVEPAQELGAPRRC
jgi:hypothetical protein